MMTEAFTAGQTACHAGIARPRWGDARSKARARGMAAGIALVAAGAAACAGDRTEAEASSPAREGTSPAVAAGAAPAAVSDSVVVYKSPTCGCCERWVEHMRASGFRVVTHDMPDVTPIKERHGIGEALASCHTALVGGYVLEGHVPAADVRRLLRERPAIIGLAVPGMPAGSPGMETGRVDRYDVLEVRRGAAPGVFTRY